MSDDDVIRELSELSDIWAPQCLASDRKRLVLCGDALKLISKYRKVLDAIREFTMRSAITDQQRKTYLMILEGKS